VEVIPLCGAKSVPAGATFHGHDGLRAMLNAGFERYPQLRIDHGPVAANGAQLTVDIDLVLDDGVHPPQVRSSGCDYRIADGRIRRIRAFEHSDVVNPSRRRSDALSPREREMLSLLAAGKTVGEIAAELFLSPFTVRTHVRNAKDKLRARTTAHAIAIAIDHDALDV
jgi:DNA-binding CsgD family transcriptional regulator